MAANVLEWLLIRYPTAKRQTLKRMVLAGRVLVNGRPASRLTQALAPGDQIDVIEQSSRRTEPEDAGLRGIVYEDADLLVVDKPAGMLTSTVPRERRPTLLADVREYLARRDPRARLGLIHRLDRDASGLLIFSKNDRAYQSLKEQFYHHTVGREYRAVVHGIPDPPAGRIESRLVERADGAVHSTRQHGKGQLAVTEYQVIRSEGKLSLLRVVLHTGRKHQIRVHLRERGWPVVGDVLYAPPDNAPRLMLAAVRLTVRHPRTADEITFSAPIPREFPLRADGFDAADSGSSP